jgi:hypothetical protein
MAIDACKLPHRQMAPSPYHLGNTAEIYWFPSTYVVTFDRKFCVPVVYRAMTVKPLINSDAIVPGTVVGGVPLALLILVFW